MEITGLDTDTWAIQINHLPVADENGHQLTYYLEHNHQDGISVNNVPNSSEDKDPRIWANPGGEYKTSIANLQKTDRSYERSTDKRKNE